MSSRKKPPSNAAQEYIASLQRKRGTRTLKQRHLIVCEDGKSARAYFEALLRHFDLDPSWARIGPRSHRTDPEQVVKRARDLKSDAGLRWNATLPFDRIWCVIDRDEWQQLQFNKARQLAKRHGIDLLISTPCFEYWLLLHFEDTSKSALNCDQLIDKSLKKRLPRYQKGSFDFSSLVDQAVKAAERAAKRRRSFKESTLPEDQNPCSEIYRLIDELRPRDDDVKKKA